MALLALWCKKHDEPLRQPAALNFKVHLHTLITDYLCKSGWVGVVDIYGCCVSAFVKDQVFPSVHLLYTPCPQRVGWTHWKSQACVWTVGRSAEKTRKIHTACSDPDHYWVCEVLCPGPLQATSWGCLQEFKNVWPQTSLLWNRLNVNVAQNTFICVLRSRLTLYVHVPDCLLMLYILRTTVNKSLFFPDYYLFIDRINRVNFRDLKCFGSLINNGRSAGRRVVESTDTLTGQEVSKACNDQ